MEPPSSPGRFNSYRTFHRVGLRIRLLYDVTVHSYGLMYEDGRIRLRDKEQRSAQVEIALSTQTVKRPLKVLTFHARDVYPQLLRSTLLVRLVAAFEAFLIDTIEEISERSDEPFASDKKLEISQRQLLALAREQGLKSFLVNKTTRQLTSGGFEEIRKFYKSTLGIDIAPANTSPKLLEEIHDRRHLYVHRAGYVDEQYVHKYPASGLRVDELAPVTEAYFLGALGLFSSAALQVKTAVESKYPDPPVWHYTNGNQQVGNHEQVVVVTARILNPTASAGLVDLSAPIGGGFTVADMTVWVSQKGADIRWLLSGSRLGVSSVFKSLAYHQDQGHIAQIDSFKVMRNGA